MSGAGTLLLLLLAQAQPVFRASVESVYVDVSVTKKDAPVLGLRADDFVVTDNGVTQTRVELLDRDSTPTTAVLALDVSASVAGQRLLLLRSAAGAFLRDMAPRDEAALVTFDHAIRLEHAPTADHRAVAETLDHVPARGSTSVVDALYYCLKRRWGDGRAMVVLFTDGQDTASWLENEDLLQAARESSVLLYVVGTEAPEAQVVQSPGGRRLKIVVSEPPHMYLLQRAADTTGGAYWSASFERLERAFLKVLEAVNARYVLRFQPEQVAPAGRHRLKVSVKRKGVEVRARREYVVPARERD